MRQGLSRLRAKGSHENVQLGIIALFTWITSFAYLRVMYIGRDTRLLGFTNFLYFSDSLKSGVLPFWNHFILSGSDFLNLNNIGLFFPVQGVFVFLSWIITPFYAFELMIQSLVVFGGVGCYLLCHTFVEDKRVAMFGATAFTVAVLVPVVSQLGFLFSFASFPWMLYLCTWIVGFQRVRIVPCVFVAVVSVWFLSAGYLWMNLVQLFMTFVFACSLGIKQRTQWGDKALWPVAINLMCFLGMVALLYASLLIPGYLSMRFYYRLFWGDYSAPDPRLRGLAQVAAYSYQTLLDAFTGAVDPMITRNNGGSFANLSEGATGAGLVSLGTGFVPWLVFLIAPWRSTFRSERLWLGFACVAFLYSAGQGNIVGHWLAYVPIFNANRWWFVGTFYVSIFVIFSCVMRLPMLKKIPLHAVSHVVKTVLVLVLFLSLCFWFHPPGIVFVVLIYGTILVYLLGIIKNTHYWENTLMVLTIVNVLAFIQINHHGFTTGSARLDAQMKVYSQLVEARVQPIVFTSNYRRLGKGHDFQCYDEQWLLKKVPFSHGFNHLSNPLYWYVKNEPFLSRLIQVTQDIRKEKHIVRENYSSDNAFATALMDDVRRAPQQPTIPDDQYQSLRPKAHFNWGLENLQVSPNTVSVRVVTSGAAFLQFNTLYFPGWHVYVNGQQQALIRSNRIFQGVFLDKAGRHDVLFTFRPMAPYVLLLPYFILLCCGIGWFYKKDSIWERLGS